MTAEGIEMETEEGEKKKRWSGWALGARQGAVGTAGGFGIAVCLGGFADPPENSGNDLPGVLGAERDGFVLKVFWLQDFGVVEAAKA
jgi:hypothetical protein